MCGASLGALGATSRFQQLLYEGAMLNNATIRAPAATAAELALLAARPDLNSDNLLRSSRDVFHYSRTARQIDEMRKQRKTEVPADEPWPATALAKLESTRRLNMYMTSSSLVLGRGSKCDVDLSSEWPSLVLSRRSAVLGLRSDGRLWLARAGQSPVFVDGALLQRGASAPLAACSTVQIGPCSLVVRCNTALLASLSTN